MEQSFFEELKNKLLIETIDFKENFTASEQFKIDFFKLLEICTFNMINNKEDFFAYFFIQMKREIDMTLNSPCQTLINGTGFTVYFNPVQFLEHNQLEMQALIKHEIYHVMSGHHWRAKAIKNKYNSTAINLAMDITINEYIINLPGWMPKLMDTRKAYNIFLNEDSTMEQYAEAIQEGLNKLKKDKEERIIELQEDKAHSLDKQYEAEKVHEIWEKDEETDSHSMKEITKKYALNANKGKLPESMEEYLRALKDGSEISWKDYLKRILGTLPSGCKKTATRKDRRQPERLELRGRLKQHIAQITVAIDISGSISDKELEQIMQEVLAIVKNYPHELTIIECDSNIRRVYKVKNIKDVKKKLNTKGYTKFSPVFLYMKEKNMKNHILIYFTDGLGEEELELTPVNNRTIWVLTGKREELSLQKPFGVIKKLTSKKVAQAEYDYAPNAIKEYRMLEWSSF